MGGGTGRSSSGRGEKKKKRGRESHPASASDASPDRTFFFPILMSSCRSLNLPYGRQMVDRLLRSHLAFVRAGGGGAVLPPGLLSLLPLLLNQKWSRDVAALAAEMVGAMALCSLEANEEIASDGATVRALVAALGNRSKAVATAACHAILDLSAAPLAREQLRKSLAVEKLLSVLQQVVIGPASEGGSYRFKKAAMEGALPSSFLEAAVVLINTCNNDFLESIPGEATREFLLLAKEVWLGCRKDQGGSASPSRHDLAEAIFRLSMNQEGFTSCPPDHLRTSIFGGGESGFEKFILAHWENSPVLLRNGSGDGDVISDCGDFCSGSMDAALESILRGSVSCPPVSSDELDILSFLEEARGSLGVDLRYGQDIRVVRTQELDSGSKGEVHFFGELSGLTSFDGTALTDDHVRRCRKAVEDGYTVALRGLEFRSKRIAGLCDGMAALFGQPSVGANLYLTPPGSQGLSRHYDDHCVFVCQLLGMKRWVVSPRSTPLLPRLYEPLGGSSSSESGGRHDEAMEFLLRQGDILYIPRGCPHEASTTAADDPESQPRMSTFSLHLTLGIEVEPPFEWQGFAHVALRCWSESQKEEEHRPVGSAAMIPSSMVVNLLHVSIGLIGDRNPIFRKACMVLSASLRSTGGRNPSSVFNLASIFRDMIACIDAQSDFSEALEKTEDAVRRKDGRFFQRLRWLRLLPRERDPAGRFDLDDLLEAFEGLLPLTRGQIGAVEAMFGEMKRRFCRFAAFEDARRSFELLQSGYRKTRRKYTNGMLALHSGSS